MGTDDNGYELAVWQSGKNSVPAPVFNRVNWSAWRRRGRTPKPTTLRRTASRASCAALRALRSAVFSGASAIVVVPNVEAAPHAGGKLIEQAIG